MESGYAIFGGMWPSFFARGRGGKFSNYNFLGGDFNKMVFCICLKRFVTIRNEFETN